jgi:DUF1680 family protein
MSLLESESSESNKVNIQDPFWGSYTELVRSTVIPYQWEALNDRIEGAEPSYAIRNFRIAAGLEEGEFGGLVFQDSDFAKWLEAVGYSLASHPDPALEKTADEVIEVIAKAQHENGYLNTYFTIKEPGKQWTNLVDDHELYCAGHMMEAAVAYFKATGKRMLLDIMCRFADYIASVFGTEAGQIRGYDGHQEIELALVKLYEVTGEQRYLKLSQYFIEERGQTPHFFIADWEKRGRTSHWTAGTVPSPNLEYFQSHLPVREQQVAIGHSVRAVYMYSAMADLARLTSDITLKDACERLWNNTTSKQMYITGGIGSTHHGEAFTFDYDLPNDTVYAETCASIGLIFFAHRMLQLDAKSEYADVMERALYNNVLGSMSKDGKHFFYVNPLEVWPKASQHNPGKHHVKPVRQKWFGCSCCPPNVARLLSSLNDYIYGVSTEKNTIYAHLFIGSEAELVLPAGKVGLKQQSQLPWHGMVSFTVTPDSHQVAFNLALRIPDWCNGKQPALSINGAPSTFREEHGYALIERQWTQGDVVEWNIPLQATLIVANPQVRANAGKAAIQRGPLVYCLEEADNGSPLASLSLSSEANLSEHYEPGLLGGAVVIELDGHLQGETGAWSGGKLYQPLQLQDHQKPIRLKAIPYYLWGNRQQGEMNVWLRTR